MPIQLFISWGAAALTSSLAVMVPVIIIIVAEGLFCPPHRLAHRPRQVLLPALEGDVLAMVKSVERLANISNSLLKNPRHGESVVIQFSVTNRRRLSCGAHL
jgi:hypothetical protein